MTQHAAWHTWGGHGGQQSPSADADAPAIRAGISGSPFPCLLSMPPAEPPAVGAGVERPVQTPNRHIIRSDLCFQLIRKRLQSELKSRDLLKLLIVT